MAWLFFLKSGFIYAAAANLEAAAPAAPKPAVHILESLFSASLTVQLAFLILAVMSIVSWAVILQKGMMFRKIKEEGLAFQDVFLKYNSFESILSLSKEKEHSPPAQIFRAGFEEMRKILKSEKGAAGSLSNVERALNKAIRIELSQIESGLSFLATTGSACPFIGLFGTVFGIMDAFSKIASMGSAGLTVVAPGIAEALLATGLGLFAAIPASIFYNNYIHKLRQLEMEFENFSMDFLNIAYRNFFNKYALEPDTFKNF